MGMKLSNSVVQLDKVARVISGFVRASRDDNLLPFLGLQVRSMNCKYFAGPCTPFIGQVLN